jgi:hypothetical protein
VIVELATGPKVRKFNLAEDDGFLRVKINTMTSFRGEVKPLSDVIRFYSMLKNPAENESDSS